MEHYYKDTDSWIYLMTALLNYSTATSINKGLLTAVEHMVKGLKRPSWSTSFYILNESRRHFTNLAYITPTTLLVVVNKLQ